MSNPFKSIYFGEVSKVANPKSQGISLNIPWPSNPRIKQKLNLSHLTSYKRCTITYKFCLTGNRKDILSGKSTSWQLFDAKR